MSEPQLTNDAGVQLIREFEGLRLQAYRDPVGIWTIGYGHTLGAHKGQRITEVEAVGFLREDLRSAEGRVNAWTRDVKTSPNEFGAMVSLCFNIGSGNFRTSSVLRLHRQGQNDAAASAFLLWNKGHVDGKLVVLPGLKRRREAERRLYLSR